MLALEKIIYKGVNMSFDDLCKKVDDYNSSLEVDYHFHPAYYLCENYLSNNRRVSSMEDFSKIDIYEAVKCLYILEHLNDDFLEISNFSESIFKYLLGLSLDEFIVFTHIFGALSELECIDVIIEYLRIEDNMEARKYVNNLRENSDNVLNYSDSKKNKIINMMVDLRKLQKNVNISGLLSDALEDSFCISKLFSLIYVHKLFNYSRGSLIEQNPAVSVVGNNEVYKIKDISKYINMITSFVNLEKKNKKDFLKKTKKVIENNNKALILLKEAISGSEIVDVRRIVNLIEDEELKHAFLEYIYEFNLKYYQELEVIYNDISNNKSTKYLQVLKSKNIVVNDLEISIFMNHNFEDFNIMLSILCDEFNLRKKDILYIFKFSNIDIVNKIYDLYKNSCLSIKVIESNIKLFNSDLTYFNNIISNINEINDRKISTRLFNNCNVLLSDSEIFKTNLSILDNYDLISSFVGVIDYSFLSDSNLEDNIKKFIELGIFSLLKNNIYLLNNCKIKRIELLILMGISFSSSDILNILNSDTFMLDDSCIDSTINNLSSINLKQLLKN